MTINTNYIPARHLIGMFVIFILSVSFAFSNVLTTHAAPIVGFVAGNIIDDPTFMNTDSMNANQIQAFLNSKVPVCDTNGTQTSEFGGGTRAQWAAARGYSPPFTCLKDYVEGGYSAAQIIYNAAQQYGINPQVLIVLLQKEQGLVTDTWPLSTQYRTATGYGCPDTAPCDSQYYGLTNQINQAANMFHQIEVANPNWYTPYVLGNNSIKWNPNSACGSSVVNIQNRATQALYNYTPYQPNQAALNAGYGMGDSCSAYGNRNFYLYFTDWFGPTKINSTLVRTVSNGTVYLVSSNTTKYPIADVNTLGALNMGGIGYVSQSYLDTLQTGTTLGRLIKDANGTVYLFDAKIKLPFTSCSLVADYGYDCGQAALLADWQIQSFVSGPNMTNFYQTTSGKNFYIKDGQKREIYDEQALSLASLSGAYNTLNESPLSSLAYGAPILRNNVVVNDRQNGDKYIVDQGQLTRVTGQAIAQTFLSQFTNRSIDAGSIGQVTLRTGTIDGYIQDATSGDKFILTNGGKLKITDATAWPDTFVSATSSLTGALTTISTANPAYLIKSSSSATVYYVENQKKRPLTAWSDVQKINSNSTIITLPNFIVDGLSDGSLVLNQGGLVKTATNGTVYFVDGLNTLIPLTNFGYATEAGIPLRVSIAPDATVSSYTKSGSTLGTLFQCGGTKYISIAGKLNKLSSSQDTAMGLTHQSLLLCPPSSVVDLPGNFFLDSTGTIYQITGGQKNPIGSWSKYLTLGGNSSNTVRVSNFVTGQIPTGSVLN